MVKCWASALGDCCDIQSKEHVVSSAYFRSQFLSVDGLPWAMSQGTQVPKKKFTSKILCKHHNESTSILDDEAKKVSDFFRNTNSLAQTKIDKIKQKNISSKKIRKFRVYRRLINGVLFEKWLLKTGINFAHIYEKKLYIGNSKCLSIPSMELLKILFNKHVNFKNGQGLYSVSDFNVNIIPSDDRFKISPIYNRENNRIIGFDFIICGWRFFLSLIPEEFALSKKEVVLSTGISNKNLKYHIKDIKGYIKNGKRKYLHSCLRFDW